MRLLTALCLITTLTLPTSAQALPPEYTDGPVAVSDCPEVMEPEPDEADVELLARLIYAEARGEDRPGWVLVGQCVLDRLADGRWGETLKKVILADGQFTALPRTIGEPVVYKEIYETARLVLVGERYDAELTILYFRVTSSRADKWGEKWLGREGAHAYYGHETERQ